MSLEDKFSNMKFEKPEDALSRAEALLGENFPFGNFGSGALPIVSVVGFHGVGKSTFINFLLGEELLFVPKTFEEKKKVGTITNILIEYSPTFKASLIPMSQSDWDQLKKKKKLSVPPPLELTGATANELADKIKAELQAITDGKVSRREATELMKIGAPIPILKYFRIMDTPGQGDYDPWRAKLWEQAVGKSRHVIWILKEGLNFEDQKERETALTLFHKVPLTILINRADAETREMEPMLLADYTKQVESILQEDEGPEVEEVPIDIPVLPGFPKFPPVSNLLPSALKPKNPIQVKCVDIYVASKLDSQEKVQAERKRVTVVLGDSIGRLLNELRDEYYVSLRKNLEGLQTILKFRLISETQRQQRRQDIEAYYSQVLDDPHLKEHFMMWTWFPDDLLNPTPITGDRPTVPVTSKDTFQRYLRNIILRLGLKRFGGAGTSLIKYLEHPFLFASKIASSIFNEPYYGYTPPPPPEGANSIRLPPSYPSFQELESIMNTPTLVALVDQLAHCGRGMVIKNANKIYQLKETVELSNALTALAKSRYEEFQNQVKLQLKENLVSVGEGKKEEVEKKLREIEGLLQIIKQ